MEYEGSYYTIGEGHKDFVAEKSMDDDNYILTLAAIAIEAVNNYYDRCVAVKHDPYLETREKEDAFAERIVETGKRK